ncbi:MAG: hypothetical protein HDR72_05470 [Ruminococcaceae bacterium]|nr:hypothetical protein [Oscillospiraceae bacterium]
MINEEINKFIEQLLEMTKNDALDWQPAQDFFNSYDISNSNAAIELNIHTHFEFVTLFEADSFYLSNNKNQFLFLLHTNVTSGKDGTNREFWELCAIIDWNDDMFVNIPDYHPADKEDRFKTLSDMIKENKYTKKQLEEKRLISFFNAFF